MFIPIDKLLHVAVLRSYVHLVYFIVYTFHQWQELLLCLLTFGGPIIFLIQVILSNAYLSLKPFVFLTVMPFSNYKREFIRARKEVAKFWSYHGKLFHDHEIVGFENIPNNGGAVLVYYHGSIPVDYILLVSKIFLEKRRVVRSVVDRFVKWVPGFDLIVQAFGCHSKSRQGCVQLLEEGHLIGVAPGGGFEAQLGTTDYKVMWKKRSGFAAVAYQANVPIIPIFTENIREAYINLETGRGLWELIYRWTKFPVVPTFGGFPVKLRTHVGNPINPKDFDDFHQLREAVLVAMENMISEHQQLPRSILRSVGDRLVCAKSSVTTSYCSASSHIEKEIDSEDLRDFDSQTNDAEEMNSTDIDDLEFDSIDEHEEALKSFDTYNEKSNLNTNMPPTESFIDEDTTNFTESDVLNWRNSNDVREIAEPESQIVTISSTPPIKDDSAFCWTDGNESDSSSGVSSLDA